MRVILIFLTHILSASPISSSALQVRTLGLYLDKSPCHPTPSSVCWVS